jgi:hypothetical protein
MMALQNPFRGFWLNPGGALLLIGVGGLVVLGAAVYFLLLPALRCA